MCELAKRISVPVSLDFMCVSSYGDATTSSGVVRIAKDLDESIEGEMAALEDKIATLEADFSKYASDFVRLNELTQEKEAAEQQLEEKMERWMYLEDLAARIAEQ